MKRLFSILIVVVLLLSLSVGTFAAQPGFGNFTGDGSYTAGQFRDVRAADWFAPYVEDAFNFGFLRGKSLNMFDPAGLLTLGESVTLAARLRSIYHTGSADFAASTPFYEVYAQYAMQHGIIDSHGDYNALATRSQFAMMIFNALPPTAFPVLNDIPDFGINDVAPDVYFGSAVYSLYRAGVLSGSDRFGTFLSSSNITRAEASAILVRVANPDTRISLTLPSEIPAEIIFQRKTSAVFMIETFTPRGRSIRNGSGFFIDDTGLAVTSLHVLDNAASATITLYDGTTYHVNGVIALSIYNNLAMLSIDSGESRFNYLTLADSDLIRTGGIVYALGSPIALFNTITEGIVSNTNREVRGEELIQFTAPISFGSGGSPVLNTLGQVVGVAASSFANAQNLNLAIPVNFIRDLEIGELITLEELNRREDED